MTLQFDPTIVSAALCSAEVLINMCLGDASPAWSIHKRKQLICRRLNRPDRNGTVVSAPHLFHRNVIRSEITTILQLHHQFLHFLCAYLVHVSVVAGASIVVLSLQFSPFISFSYCFSHFHNIFLHQRCPVHTCSLSLLNIGTGLVSMSSHSVCLLLYLLSSRAYI